MSETILDFLERKARPKILVAGDLILDRYVFGDVKRISPEAPIQVLHVQSEEHRLGGAGNVARNLAVMGAQVSICGFVGEDAHGHELLRELGDLGIDTELVPRLDDRPTVVKTRLIASKQQVLRVDHEQVLPLREDLEHRLVQQVVSLASQVDAILLSDYAKGALPPSLIEAAIQAGKRKEIPVLIDPKGQDYSRYRGAAAITPNRAEASAAIGHDLSLDSDLEKAAEQFLRELDLQAIVITLGPDGMYVRERSGSGIRIPTKARMVYDVTGAGDTAIALMALGRAGGLDWPEAVALANAGAGVVVGKVGATAVTPAELQTALGGRDVFGASKILQGAELEDVVASLRRSGKRIVFTNGCFDLIHPGHIEYLSFAREHGDVLIVGVNSDDSIHRIKGPSRPILNLQERQIVLAGLETVSYVTSFDDDTPQKLIERVSPDILVKGEDWREKGVVGREWVESHGGRVVLAPLRAGSSTTDIIGRIEKQLGGR
ncbi:MAG: D-glycero-beta-D-manno-heptose-7-phosphate kinase [Planctomycetota bacterium]